MSYTYTCHVGGEKNIFTDRQKCLDDCTGQCYDQEGIPLGDKYAWPCLSNQQIRNEVCCKVKGEGEECKEINIACVLERAAANVTACSPEGARQRKSATCREKGCPPEFLGNDECNWQCNIGACNYDGGKCYDPDGDWDLGISRG